jgi:hypothetical protein
MGAACTYGNINQEEAFFMPDGKVMIHKKQVYFLIQNTPSNYNEAMFYDYSTDHKSIQQSIVQKRSSMRFTTKQYPNGSTKVILF